MDDVQIVFILIIVKDDRKEGIFNIWIWIVKVKSDLSILHMYERWQSKDVELNAFGRSTGT